MQVKAALLLQVVRGNPSDILPKVWKDWAITKLCFEQDTEPYAVQRDSKVQELAKSAGLVPVLCFCSGWL